MTLSVTNTLTGEREDFESQADDDVLLYVCGLTVSDDAHLGHARLWMHSDIMHRWLEYEGYDVHHVENFTDVNEKIAARIGEDDLGADESTVAEHFVGDVIRDMRGLNLKRAEVYPRVTEHIPEIIDLIETLVERGHAYESNGSVYFDVTTFDDYGKLSNQKLDELQSQAEGDEQSEKRNAADFALWKAGAVTPEEAAEHRNPDLDPITEPCGETWDSPWGEGRPGWHIECSAMSMTHLDETIDIHVGGRDLVFPHHENEIAQSEAATGNQFARYWLHVGLLQTDGDKMSSSLGNYFYVADALDEFGVDVIRTFYLSTAYGSEQTYSEETIAEAEERWDRLERAYEGAVAACDSPDARTKVEATDLRETVESVRENFRSAMNDDFNVREAMAELLGLATAVNRHLDAGDTYDYRALREAIETFEDLGGEVFGLSFGEAADDGDVSIAADLVQLVLDVREAEREAGNYERADDLRDDLTALGVDVEDGADGATFRFE
ncbi:MULTISPECIES: cysteine--tRNA ligase [Haloferax]|uniref:Cysteine--tRNA ligase n=2 Tax=Haloferax TaxID=2251 RepID=A0A6G1Z5E1_9EURY|nr:MULTISPECIES: cysteine--tRNA ligase [Haloferax]KAB1188809.1 cysteine--tRNA ligase [Haloferax sp. CBA1149]MRW81524.1 cysteine--tRNA ligase [Haloferax marinisediminis]